MSNSIGDLKNSGLQGNNWPWQYKVLLGLDGIINAIGTGTEYEAQIVKATCPGPTPSSGYYLEIRIYNTTTGSFGAPTYYLPGSTTPVNLSTCTKEYANDSAILTQIYNELVTQGTTLTSIETAVEGTLTVQANDLDIRPLTCTDIVSLCFDNAGTPTPVSNTNPLPVNAIVTVPSSLDTTIVGPVGVQADCANAVSTVLCQAQQDILTNIQTAVEGTLDVNVTNIVDVSGSNVLVTGTVTAVVECADSSIKICDADGHVLDVNADGSINTNITNLSLTVTTAGANSAPVGMYGSTDGGLNWTAVQVDTFGAVSTNANISGPLGIRDCTEAVSVALCDDQNLTITAIENHVAPNDVTPNILISSGDAPVTITVPVYSITFFNNGSVDVNVSMDGGTSNALIPAGVTITMDAGGIKNSYAANTFIVGSTIAVGASMIVTYNS
jgi:hypothetical protein